MIKISEEFRDLISPLNNDAFELLQDSILEDGCRDPIVLWDNVIVDGHHRYKICIKHGIEFKTVNKEFDSVEDAQIWMIINQIGKRNLHGNEVSYGRGKQYLLMKQSHGGQLEGGDNLSPPLRTKDKIAREIGVAGRTIMRDAKFAQAVDLLPEYRNEILTGITELTKQDITDIGAFIDMDKHYEVETHILYNNPKGVGIHTKIFNDIDKLIEKYKSLSIKSLSKTDKRKRKNDREYVLWDVEVVEFDVLKYILSKIKDQSIADIKSHLLKIEKDSIGIEARWIPVMSEEDYKKIKEIEAEEFALLERKLYTPKIVHGDSLKEITKLSSESIDLIVTDPPYNMDKAEWDSYGSAEEFADWAEQWLSECFRVLKPHGSIYVFGLNRMLSHIQMRMEKIGFKYRNWIIWDTIQGAGGGLWVNRQEAILYFSKTDAPYEDKESIKLERSEENVREYKGVEYKFKNPSNIWRYPTVDGASKERTIHPTQKPVGIIERMVKANSKEGDLILDCFMGSGTTGVATMKNKRRCIGFEMDSAYIEISNDRFEDVKI